MINAASSDGGLPGRMKELSPYRKTATVEYPLNYVNGLIQLFPLNLIFIQPQQNANGTLQCQNYKLTMAADLGASLVVGINNILNFQL